MPGGTETILLVEDQEAVRMLAASILRDLGYRVLEAEGPIQAREFVSEHCSGEGIQLLLTDANVRGASGSELADSIKTDCREMKVLVMSGYASQAGARQSLSERGFAWLQKPFTPAALARAVREILDQE
jgi:DNA-binding NtrC family response regulator